MEEKECTINELFAQLEDTIQAMEDPEISLEDSFRLYEQGIGMVKQCNEKLDLVEKKMLMIAGDDSLQEMDE